MPDRPALYCRRSNAHGLIGGYCPTYTIRARFSDKWFVPEPPWILVVHGLDGGDAWARMRWEIVELARRLMKAWKTREEIRDDD